MSGAALVLIGTPIGNLGDLSPRAVEALQAADVIACEDTRVARKLLTRFGVHAKKLVAVHDHNETERAAWVVGQLDAGLRVAVVSDAGMPGIADPGEHLVAAAAAAGHRVEVVPGPSAAITALVVSGLPAGRFCFEGFLPRKGGGRTTRLNALAAEQRTTIVYEAPHRVRETVADLVGACGPGRPVAVGRELTKLFEEVWRGTLGELVDHLDEKDPRGEYVLVLGGATPPEAAGEDDVVDALWAHLGAGQDRKTAVAAVAKELGVPKRDVYDVALRL